MTVFHFEGMSATSSPKKVPYVELEDTQSFSNTRTCKYFKMEARGAPFEQSSVFSDTEEMCSGAEDFTCETAEEQILGSSPEQLGTSLTHDHSYTKCSPQTSEEACSSDMDDSLQSLFDTCELDRAFLAEAKPAFRQFLDDVLDDVNVPSDDELDLLHPGGLKNSASHHVPTKVSWSLPRVPHPTSCLFTSAGSNDTVLTASVALGMPHRSRGANSSASSSSSSSSSSSFSTLTSDSRTVSSVMTSCVSSTGSRFDMPLFGGSCSSSSSSAAGGCISSTSSSSPPSCDNSSLDSKLKDVIDFLFNEKSADNDLSGSQRHHHPAVTSFLNDVAICNNTSRPQAPMSHSDSVEDCLWPVTMSHRIQDGACVTCSPAPLRQASPYDNSGRYRPALRLNTSFTCLSSSAGTDLNNNNDTSSMDNITTSSPTAAAGHLCSSPCSSLSSSSSSSSSSLPSSLALSTRCGKRKSCETKQGSSVGAGPVVCSSSSSPSDDIGSSQRGTKRARLQAQSDADRDEVLSLMASFPSSLPLSPSPISPSPLRSSSFFPQPDTEMATKNNLGVESSNVSLSGNCVGLKSNPNLFAKAKQSTGGVFDCLTFVRSTKIPLSPININHYGRCG